MELIGVRMGTNGSKTDAGATQIETSELQTETRELQAIATMTRLKARVASKGIYSLRLQARGAR